MNTNTYIHPIPFAKWRHMWPRFSSYDWLHVFFLLFFRLFPAHMNGTNSRSSSLILHCFCCCSIDWCRTLMPGYVRFTYFSNGQMTFSDTIWNFPPGKSRTPPLQIVTPLSLTSQLLHLWNTPSFQPVTEAQLPHPQLEHLRLFSRTLALEGLNRNSFTAFVFFHLLCCSSGLCFRCKSTKTKADPQLIRFIHAFRWMSKDELACVSRSTEDHCERQKPHFHLNWFRVA